MRVLMSAYYIQAHIRPALRLATAVKAAGHDVRVASTSSAIPYIQSAGLTPLVVDEGEITIRGALPSFETEQEARKAHTDVFPHWLEGLQRCAEEWRPDVIVREWSELAGMIVAARIGVPCVVSGVMLRLPPHLLRKHLCTLILDPGEYAGLMAGWNLGEEWPADRFRAHFYGDLWLSPYPPSLAFPGTDLHNERHIQPLLFDRIGEAESAPAWLGRLGDQPVVNATMGTTFNHVPKVFECFVEAFAGRDVQLVLTIGQDRDPAEFEPLPPNVRVERYVPQTLLFPHCAAALMHGGFNTMLAALTYGVPAGFFPFGADQSVNAGRCAALGAGHSYPAWLSGAPADDEAMQPDLLDPERVWELTRVLLEEPAYRRAARRVRAEIDGLPTVDRAVGWVEDLVSRR